MARLRIPLVVFLASAAALLTACGGNDSPSQSSPAAATQSDEGLQALLDSTLLQLDDFPPGWFQRTDERGNDGPEFSSLEECASLHPEESQAATTGGSTGFTGPEREFVTSTVAVFDDEQAALDAIKDLRSAFRDCAEP